MIYPNNQKKCLFCDTSRENLLKSENLQNINILTSIGSDFLGLFSQLFYFLSKYSNSPNIMKVNFTDFSSYLL